MTVKGEVVRECVGVDRVDESRKDAKTVTRAERSQAEETYRNRKRRGEEIVRFWRPDNYHRSGDGGDVPDKCEW